MTGHAQDAQDAGARGYMPVAQTTDWETPRALFDALDAEFGPFTLDPCGQKEAHYSAYTIFMRGGLFYDGSTPELDGLAQPWSGTVFMNPPFGRGMAAWIKKAVTEVEAGNAERVVALLPVRSDTKVWQQYILRGVDRIGGGWPWVSARRSCKLVRFLGAGSPGMEGRSRVRFGGAPVGAPFPCAIVVWEQ